MTVADDVSARDTEEIVAPVVVDHMAGIAVDDYQAIIVVLGANGAGGGKRREEGE